MAFLTSLGHSGKKKKERKQSAAGVQIMGMAQKDVSGKNNALPPYLFSPCSLVAPQLQLCERVEQDSRVLFSSPTRPPSALGNETFLELHNCSVHT